MIEIIKKTMLAGIGATVVTKDAIEKQLQELVDKGKISTDEARKTADKITEEGREEFNKIKVEAEHFVEDLLQRGTLVTRSQWEELNERIAALEEKLKDS